MSVPLTQALGGNMKLRMVFALLIALTLGSASARTVSPEQDWTYEMGWRYVKYSDRQGSLVLSIEPMVKGADIVYVPDIAIWNRNSSDWPKNQSRKILDRLKSVQWNRHLSWEESEKHSFSVHAGAIPGSLESTPGGIELESHRLFHPGAQLTTEQAHEIWEMAARKFAEAATGRVTVFASSVNRDTVFGAIELPALEANQNVTLDWR